MRARPLLGLYALGALLGGTLLAASAPAAAVPSVGTLSRSSGPVSWSGTWTTPSPLGCGRQPGDVGCERQRLVVNAPAGTWITVSLQENDVQAAIDVTTDDGTEVVQGGDHLNQSAGDRMGHPSVTWPQVRSGSVGYLVGTSVPIAYPASPLTDAQRYHVKATLTGKAFDRQPDCLQIPPDHVPTIPADTSRRMRLSVRVLSSAADARAVRAAMPEVASIYRQIGIDVRLSYDTLEVPASMIDQYALLAAERAHYGGSRPRGVDVVYFATDNFGGGGYADCVGGVAYGERAFAVGGIHYWAGGVVPVSYVRTGVIAAHEIGHLLGAEHHYATCGASAEPDSATGGDVGPCTLMFPAAAGVSPHFSVLETAYIRDYAGRFARG